MKRWWVTIVLLLSVGINVGLVVALAVGRVGPARLRSGQMPPEAPIGQVGGLARRMGLGTAAADSFGRLHRRFFEETRRLRRHSMELRQELFEELIAEDPDRPRLEEIVSGLGAAQLQMERALVRSTLESRALLNEEQERHYLRFLSERMHRMSGHGPGRGPGRSPGRAGPPARRPR